MTDDPIQRESDWVVLPRFEPEVHVGTLTQLGHKILWNETVSFYRKLLTMALRRLLNGFRKCIAIGKAIMGKYVLIVQSRPKEGRDDEYNKWFDGTHFAEMSDLPGVKSGRRMQATPIAIGAPGLPYISVFDIEIDDPGAFMAEMGKRSSDGTWKGSDALDAPATVLWLYKDYEMPS